MAAKLKKTDTILSHRFLPSVSASIRHSHCFLSAVCVLLFAYTHACICVRVCVRLCCHAEASCTANVLREPKGHTVLNTSAWPTPRQQSSTMAANTFNIQYLTSELMSEPLCYCPGWKHFTYQYRYRYRTSNNSIWLCTATFLLELQPNKVP